MTVSVIIVNHNGADFTTECVSSLRRCSRQRDYEVIVVDNGSRPDERRKLTSGLSSCRIMQERENMGYGRANNAAASEAKGEFLFFVNNDTIFTEDVLKPLVACLRENRRAGLAGPALANSDGTFQLSFGRFPSLWNEWRTRQEMRRLVCAPRGGTAPQAERSIEWLSGAALMVRAELFRTLGGFDDSYFMYFEDVDLCYRASRAGYGIHYLDAVTLIHHGGKSYEHGEPRIEREYRRSQIRFYDKFRPVSQQLLLRGYLFVKYVLRIPQGSKRRIASEILSLLGHRQGRG